MNFLKKIRLGERKRNHSFRGKELSMNEREDSKEAETFPNIIN